MRQSSFIVVVEIYCISTAIMHLFISSSADRGSKTLVAYIDDDCIYLCLLTYLRVFRVHDARSTPGEADRVYTADLNSKL